MSDDIKTLEIRVNAIIALLAQQRNQFADAVANANGIIAVLQEEIKQLQEAVKSAPPNISE